MVEPGAVEQLEQLLEGTSPSDGMPIKKDIMSEIMALAGLDVLDREAERNRISQEHNIRRSVIDKLVSDHEKAASVSEDIVVEVIPWGSQVDGDELLTEICETLYKHVVLPENTAEAISTWILLTYCYGAFRVLPILGIESPTKRCGKTTLLEILHGLCNKSLVASNISPAAVYRTIEKYQPTLLADEADTFIKENDELRGVLNSGHTRAGAFVIRVEGDNHEPVKFSTWGPKAVAMIGRLPDTLRDRSIVVSLRRKALGEKVSRIGVDFDEQHLRLRRMCQRWANDNMVKLPAINPDMPPTGNDRASDNWTPLLAIADVIGGEWPERVRKSMANAIDTDDESIGALLLGDIRGIFQDIQKERIFSDDLVEHLINKEESPWFDWRRGKGLSQNGLARLLKPFDIHSKTLRIADERRKGYELQSFLDAFRRYLSPIPPNPTVTPRQINNINNLHQNQNVTKEEDVTDKNKDNQLNLFDCHVVTDEKGCSGEKEGYEVF